MFWFWVMCCSVLLGGMWFWLYLNFPLPYKQESTSTRLHLDISPMHKQLPAVLENVKCFQPLELGQLKLRNRIIRAACFGGGNIDELIATHAAVAKGGVAMTTIAYASVSSDGRSFSGQLLLDHSCADIDLARLPAAIHREGAAICMQLTHAGGFADRHVIGCTQIAPSRLFNPAGLDWPRAMTELDLQRVCADFVSAALLCKRAGFDAVELHCGHGYLLSQFLSPHSNRRTDRWGGSTAGRQRFPLLVFNELRRALGPNFPILVKLNASDGFRGGLELDEAIVHACAFAQAGCDAIVVSGGFVSLSGFYMLRGRVPLWSMAQAMLSQNWLKGLALLLFGHFLVPEMKLDDCFFRASARAIRSAVNATPPTDKPCHVCYVGGLRRLSMTLLLLLLLLLLLFLLLLLLLLLLFSTTTTSYFL
jgi:2,4-dienoyl-CoA reductase-like NADH-dependent reductase (Old Yellow Enzyme family)